MFLNITKNNDGWTVAEWTSGSPSMKDVHYAKGSKQWDAEFKTRERGITDRMDAVEKHLRNAVGYSTFGYKKWRKLPGLYNDPRGKRTSVVYEAKRSVKSPRYGKLVGPDSYLDTWYVWVNEEGEVKEMDAYYGRPKLV